MLCRMANLVIALKGLAFSLLPPSPLDNIRVMVRTLEGKGNIIRTALCWIVWRNVHSQQHTYTSSSYRSNRLGSSHWHPYAVRRGGCLELYYCNIASPNLYNYNNNKWCWVFINSLLMALCNWLMCYRYKLLEIVFYVLIGVAPSVIVFEMVRQQTVSNSCKLCVTNDTNDSLTSWME